MGKSTIYNYDFNGYPNGIPYTQMIFSEVGTTPDLVATSGVGNTVLTSGTIWIVGISGNNASGNMVDYPLANTYGPANQSGWYWGADPRTVLWSKGFFGTFQDCMDNGWLPTGTVYTTYAYYDASSLEFNKFTMTHQPGQSLGGWMYTSNNKLAWQPGFPAPDPMGSFKSNYMFDVFDLTLDIQSARYYDGRYVAALVLKATSWPFSSALPDWNQTITATIDTLNNEFILGSKNVNRQVVTMNQDFPMKVRFVVDDQKTFSCYIDDVLLTTYQFDDSSFVNGQGVWGAYVYGPWQFDFNGITFKGDRRDNAF